MASCSPISRLVLLGALALGVSLGGSLGGGAISAQAEQAAVHVMTDRAKVFRIDAPADTVIVGNPAIADVTMYDRMTVVVTGKLFGTTNLVILDAEGEPIIDEVITVTAPESDLVTVHRNTARTSYSCAPLCEPVLRVGDAEARFDLTSKQSQARTQMSERAAGIGQ
ncbi:pilus assembly protein N-terminal domain-containing protein [Stappia sp.]|uniref:pilus assembly protein N-terminal domain-containing protein n=1 Tax=Stappia sp. TaxID=1870903 RepID=UPI0032D8CDFB